MITSSVLLCQSLQEEAPDVLSNNNEIGEMQVTDEERRLFHTLSVGITNRSDEIH